MAYPLMEMTDRLSVPLEGWCSRHWANGKSLVLESWGLPQDLELCRSREDGLPLDGDDRLTNCLS